MKKLFVTLTLIATLCSANLSHGADRYVTLLKVNTTTSISQAIAADEVVTCVLAHCPTHHDGPSVTVTIGGTEMNFGQINTYGDGTNPNSRGFYQWTVAGPCTVKLQGSSIRTYIITLKISPNPNIMGVKQ